MFFSFFIIFLTFLFIYFSYNLIFIDCFIFSFSLLPFSFIFLIRLLIIFIRVCGFCFSYFSSLDFIRFYIIFFIFCLSIILLIVHDSIFLLFLSWDGLGISSFFLVAYYINWSSINGALVTILSNRFGDFCLFWFFTSLIFYNNFFSIFFPILLLITAFTKRAQYPFCNWLPLAIAAPTPVSSLVHRRTLVTAGMYLVFRYFSFFEMYYFLLFLFMGGIFTSFVAGLCSLWEPDFKKIIALRTLSQMGFLFFCLGISSPSLSFFHIIIHAFFKSCLFIQVGTIILTNFGTQESRFFISSFTSPISIFNVFVCCLSLCGQTFLRGFFSKERILFFFSFKSVNYIFFFVLWCCVLFTFFYTFRILWGSISKNVNNIFHYFSSGDLFYSFVLILGGLFVGFFMAHSYSFLFFYLSVEKFFPSLILLLLSLLIINFLLSCFFSPGIFFLDFLVSSIPYFISFPLKIIDFFILSNFSFQKNFLRKFIYSLALLESRNYFFIFIFIFFFILFFYYLKCYLCIKDFESLG